MILPGLWVDRIVRGNRLRRTRVPVHQKIGVGESGSWAQKGQWKQEKVIVPRDFSKKSKKKGLKIEEGGRFLGGVGGGKFKPSGEGKARGVVCQKSSSGPLAWRWGKKGLGKGKNVICPGNMVFPFPPGFGIKQVDIDEGWRRMAKNLFWNKPPNKNFSLIISPVVTFCFLEVLIFLMGLTSFEHLNPLSWTKKPKNWGRYTKTHFLGSSWIFLVLSKNPFPKIWVWVLYFFWLKNHIINELQPTLGIRSW